TSRSFGNATFWQCSAPCILTSWVMATTPTIRPAYSTGSGTSALSAVTMPTSGGARVVCWFAGRSLATQGQPTYRVPIIPTIVTRAGFYRLLVTQRPTVIVEAHRASLFG